MLFFGPVGYDRHQKMANIGNILPILVTFRNEIKKHFGYDIFWVFYIQ